MLIYISTSQGNAHIFAVSPPNLQVPPRLVVVDPTLNPTPHLTPHPTPPNSPLLASVSASQLQKQEKRRGKEHSNLNPKTKTKHSPNSVSSALAAKVMHMLADPLLPGQHKRMIVPTTSESEYEHPDDEGSWSSEEMGSEDEEVSFLLCIFFILYVWILISPLSIIIGRAETGLAEAGSVIGSATAATAKAAKATASATPSTSISSAAYALIQSTLNDSRPNLISLPLPANPYLALQKHASSSQLVVSTVFSRRACPTCWCRRPRSVG
jgi:hypothetical protein